MIQKYITEINSLRERLHSILYGKEKADIELDLDFIKLRLEDLLCIEEKIIGIRADGIHFLSKVYLESWLQSIKDVDRNNDRRSIQILVKELYEYLELPALLCISAVENKGAAFGGDTLKIIEYCYCHEKNEEAFKVARNIIKTAQIDIFPNLLPTLGEWISFVEYDEKYEMYYMVDPANLPDFKVYLPKSIYGTEEEAKWYGEWLVMEQDIHSPHRYLNERMEVQEGAVLIDAGVAEGNFTASCINKVSKAYLIECDKEFIEALKITFKDYLEKIVFVNKYLDRYDDETHITIDTLLNGEDVDYIKMDIEGKEIDALMGASETLSRSPNLKCNICTYHHLHDNEMIRKLLKPYGFEIQNTEGYMCFHLDEEYQRYPRRGLLQAIKSDSNK